MTVEIFISHITAERELALLLKERIEKHFLGLVGAFVSSDQKSIEAGESWLDALSRALKTASLQVVLCSPASIGRPWVNFEAGAAWLKGIPVVPLCHSGLEPDALPMPLSALQGGRVSDGDTFQRLYNRIAKLVPCECPDIDMKALAAAASAMHAVAGAPVPPPPVLRPIDELRNYAQAGNENALQELAVTQSPEGFDALMDIAVNHTDDKVKVAAIQALAGFRTPGDLGPLCKLLVEDRWLVASACAKALGRFKDPKSIPALILAADQHVDWVTTRDAVTALGVFAPQQPGLVCPALIRALALGSFEGEAAAQSLRRYDQHALPYLLDGLHSGVLVRGASLALKTVALIGGKEALPRLEALHTLWQAQPGGNPLLPDLNKAMAQLQSLPAPPA